MATYKTHDFEAALLRKGFRVDQTDHHRFWYFLDEIKTSVVTRTSHSEKEFDDYLFGRRCAQMHLTKKQMLNFIQCSFTAKEYRDHLLETGVVKLRSEEA